VGTHNHWNNNSVGGVTNLDIATSVTSYFGFGVKF
jgi:hypothetical protein